MSEIEKLQHEMNRLVDWRNSQVRGLEDRIREINREFDKQALQLSRKMEHGRENVTTTTATKKPKKSKPKPATDNRLFESINQWNRDNGLPEVG